MRKKLILTMFSLSIIAVINAQNVGIGITTPTAFFNVAPGKTVLFGSDTTSSAIKLMWLPFKGAFRAGYYFGSTYDTIGLYSTAMGFGSAANGFGSTAMGNADANGDYSTAMGEGLASGKGSTAMGGGIASGGSSTAMGNSSASGNFSTAMGNSTASADYSTAMGYTNVAKSEYETVIGTDNDASNTNRLFEIGNGTDNTKHNALTVLSNGLVGIGTANPVALLEADYISSTASPQLLLNELSKLYQSIRSISIIRSIIIIANHIGCNF